MYWLLIEILLVSKLVMVFDGTFYSFARGFVSYWIYKQSVVLIIKKERMLYENRIRKPEESNKMD